MSASAVCFKLQMYIATSTYIHKPLAKKMLRVAFLLAGFMMFEAPIVAAQVWCPREFMGNPGETAPHIHCGNAFLLYTTAGRHHHIHCIRRGRLNANSCRRALQACQADFGNQICALTFGRACQARQLTSSCREQQPDL